MNYVKYDYYHRKVVILFILDYFLDTYFTMKDIECHPKYNNLKEKLFGMDISLRLDELYVEGIMDIDKNHEWWIYKMVKNFSDEEINKMRSDVMYYYLYNQNGNNIS